MSNLLEKASIITTPTAYSDGVLHSVKPEQTLGSELAVNGDFATDSDWNKGTGWVIENGVLRLTTTSTDNTSQAIGLVQNNIYKITFTVSDTTLGGVRIRLGIGSLTGVYTNGTHTIQLKQTTANDAFRIYSDSSGVFNGSIDNVSVKEVIDADFTFTRNNIGTRVNASGNIESVGVDLPRIDYRGGSGSLLLEPEATNTATYSNDFSQGTIFISSSDASTANGVILTANATTSPEGLTNASKIQIGTTNSGFNRLRYASVNMVSGNINTVSIFAKKGSGVDWFGIFVDGIDASSRVWFDLENGVLGNKTASVLDYKIEDYGNGWYRCSISFTTVTDTNGVVSFVITDSNGGTSYAGDLTDHHFIYGLQAESHATREYATSYIPTSEGTGTRAADSATDAGSSDLISSTEGVLYAEFSTFALINNNESISLSNGGTGDVVRFLLHNTLDNKIAFQVKIGGSNVFFRSYILSDITAFNKVAIKYKQDDYAIWINGVEEHIITSGAVPTLNELNFTSGSNVGNEFIGNVKCVAVFKEALTDAELTCLTTI